MTPIYQATLDATPGQTKIPKHEITAALQQIEIAPTPNPIRDLVPELPALAELQNLDPNDLFTALRDKQWLIDYLCANALREYTMHRVRSSYDPQSNTPLMSPQEIKHTSAILRDVQTIQRLALNQSTENVDTPIARPPTDDELSNQALAAQARRHIHKALQSGNLAAAKFVLDATPDTTKGPTPNVRVIFSDAPEIPAVEDTNASEKPE